LEDILKARAALDRAAVPKQEVDDYLANLDIPDIEIEYQDNDDDEVCDGCSI